MAEDDATDEAPSYAPRSFWSGTITFGLVSIPVELYSANRTVRPSLRMLSADGEPLRRTYFDAGGEREVDRDAIVRGYEVEDGRFVTVSDEELEAVAPDKSRDIHLRRFVPRDQISPAYYRRSYFMAPSGRSTRPYAVLAQTMEKTGRAGIATFVMRGKEYLVAIVADHGVLRAETLRFADELRSRSDVGLGEPVDPPRDVVKSMAKAIRRATKKAIPRALLEDARTEALEALAARKQKRGEDVVEVEPAGEPLGEREETASEPPDLVALLRRRLEAKGEGEPTRRAAKSKRSTGDDGRGGGDLEALGKDALYERAKALDVEGRSKMTKKELVRAIRDAS
ncbi:MAG TPA: Ku protein [Sandaracinaceae bacterium LLY-WYZ-13_1]|nr:Ku protein [Sandaracinaceae bacterium LLY-WYZ-13_1]